MIIWIIGMSASGKTTLGNEMYKILKNVDNWVLLDGDMVRAFIGKKLGHTIEDRRTNAYKISDLCKFFDMQGINVIACVLSIFHDNQKYNREILSNYKEIFIDVDFEKLVERDNKKLYKKALNGELKNFVGVDIDFPKPFSPDIIIDNNKDNINMTKMALNILSKLNLFENIKYNYSLEDKIKNPEKYQYSTFLGESFFEAYVKSRNEAIKILKKPILELIEDKKKKINLEDFLIDNNLNKINKIELIKFVKKELKCSKGELSSQNNFNETIETNLFLFDLWKKIITDKHFKKNEVIDIDILLKRFEVSKKIRKKYISKNFLKIDDESEEMINYILFSNILLNLIKKNTINKSKKYIYINTILKLNDLIVSCISKIFKKSEIILTYILLIEELKLFYKVKEEELC
jgi:cytidine diphosphoramidate kinase